MTRSVSRFARRLVAVAIAAALLVPMVGVVPVAACEGCTPGYWKNHTDMWPSDYTTTKTLEQAGFLFPAALDDYADWTMLQALQGGGGTGVDGAAKILVRAATAALLNSAAGIGLEAKWVFLNANEALRTQDRAWMLYIAGWFDGYNNLGCPY